MERDGAGRVVGFDAGAQVAEIDGRPMSSSEQASVPRDRREQEVAVRHEEAVDHEAAFDGAPEVRGANRRPGRVAQVRAAAGTCRSAHRPSPSGWTSRGRAEARPLPLRRRVDMQPGRRPPAAPRCRTGWRADRSGSEAGRQDRTGRRAACRRGDSVAMPARRARLVAKDRHGRHGVGRRDPGGRCRRVGSVEPGDVAISVAHPQAVATDGDR